jgi:hypothetical protein
LDNVAFSDQFARQIAFSPDNRLLALSYGISRDPHGLAFFGLYSLSDGRRMATLPGDVYRCGILHGALLNDELHCPIAPLDGVVQFSPDSKLLFASSEHLHEWNVSELQ